MKFAAWTKDREALKAASSGGIFYELAKQFVTDGGVVCGVIMEGTTPKFRISSNLNIIKKMRGSKYIWANPAPMYNIIAFDTELKDCGHKILFVGLPCQVAGLKRYMKIKELSDENITYVSLRCHGVIKASIFEDYISQLKNTPSNIIFRSKVNGWQGAGFGFNGKFFKPKLIKDYIKQRNIYRMCKNCTKDRNDSDITLGDAWGIHPALRNKYGTSVMETNTMKGHRLFMSIAHTLHWKLIPGDIANIPVNPDKIGLLKVADTKNFGNQMLSCNFITHTKKLNKNAKFVFIEEHSARDIIETETGLKTDIDYCSIKNSPLEFFKRLVNPAKTELVQTFADCKHVVILGGDYLTNKWKYRSWISNLVMINALNKCGKQVHVISNTVGEFPLLLRPFVKFVFNNMKAIWGRDFDSISRLYNLKVKKNVTYAPDLAFLPLHNESKYDMLEKLKGIYCIIVTSSLWSQYANTYKEYIDGVKAIAWFLHSQTGKDILIMPHGTGKADIQITKDVESKEENIYAIKPLTPNTARNMLAHSYLNVSFRMHGAISSLSRGVPVVAIAYSHKYKGVIADGFGLPELVVEKTGRRNWNKCIYKTVSAIDYAVKHHSMLTKRISKIKNLMKMDAILQLSGFKEKKI